MEKKLQLEAPWDIVKEQLKEVNTSLTDDDLVYDENNASQLLHHLAKKLNKSEDEVKVWIESVSSNKGKAS